MIIAEKTMIDKKTIIDLKRWQIKIHEQTMTDEKNDNRWKLIIDNKTIIVIFVGSVLYDSQDSKRIGFAKT